MFATIPGRIIFGFGVFAIAMVFLNLLTDRGNLWAIWPIWAVSMPVMGLAGALSLRRHRILGLWIGFSGMLMLGLTGIDISDGGTWWFYWPGIVWLVLTLAVIGMSVDLLSMVPTSRPATEDEITDLS